MPIAIFIVLLLILFVLAPWLLSVAAAIAALISVPVMIGIACGAVALVGMVLWVFFSELYKGSRSPQPVTDLPGERKACQHCQLEIPVSEHHCRHCGKLTR